MTSVIERARRYMAKCPPAISGQGGHDATFHVASVLVHGFALPEREALALLREYNATCQPPWSERELVHKVTSAASAQQQQARGHLLGKAEGQRLTAKGEMEPPYVGCYGGRATHAGGPPAVTREPRVVPGGNANCKLKIGNCSFGPLPGRGGEGNGAAGDPVEAAERWLKGFRCEEADLFHASAVALEGGPRLDGAVLVRALYAAGERINFVTEYAEYREKSGEVKARPMGKGITLEREAVVARFEERGSDTSRAGGWLRMNPVDGQGIGDANVTAFRFALLESDTLSMELQLALFAKLPLPIAAILSSGGRSLHAWVKVDARDAAEYRAVVPRLLGILGKFGVDGKNKNPSRLSRLPGATRVIGATGDGVQRLLYVNPQPTERSIL